jgi:glycerophosphoryl diester phosphodiesterase
VNQKNGIKAGTTMKIRGMKKNRPNHIKTLFIYEALYKSVFLVVLFPFASYLIQLALKISKYSYITFQNLFAFATSPATILAILFIIVIAALLFFAEMIGLYQFFHYNHQMERMHVSHILFPSIKQAMTLLTKKGNRLLPFFCLLSYLIYSFPVFIGMISKQRIPSYIFDNIAKKPWVIPALVLVAFLCVYLYYRGMFVVLYSCFDGVKFIHGFKMSKQTIRGNRKPILFTFISRNALLCIVYVLLYYTIVIISGIVTFFAVKDSLATAMFLTIYDQINRYYSLVAGVLGALVNCKITYDLFMKYRITTCDLPGYVESYRDKISNEIGTQGNLSYRDQLRKSRHSRVVLYLGVSCFLFLSTTFLYYFTNTMFRQKAPLFGAYITAHRGYSSSIPENTLPAVQAAIDAMSDYAEIDVQETKDGVVVLMHDSNLKRTTGVNKSIWNVTYEQLQTYDAGYKARKIYRNTPVPTLEEVLMLSQNSIFLNIEIKITNHEQQLVEEVVRLIEKYDMEEQCIISSTNYGALRRVKQANDTIKTGYIMSLAYGFFYNREYADFFSIKSSFITQDMIRLAHSYGKEIHAWTVNGVSEMERMKQLGVDNIITDYPLRAREILYEDKLTTSFLDFLKTLTPIND